MLVQCDDEHASASDMLMRMNDLVSNLAINLHQQKRTELLMKEDARPQVRQQPFRWWSRFRERGYMFHHTALGIAIWDWAMVGVALLQETPGEAGW